MRHAAARCRSLPLTVRSHGVRTGKTGDDIADGDGDNDSDTEDTASAATPRTDDTAEEAVGKALTNAVGDMALGKEAECHKGGGAAAAVPTATMTVDCD